MPKQLEAMALSRVCLICRKGIQEIEQAVAIAEVLVVHERCARVSRVG